MFDDGWDVYREKTLERQKRLGVVPEDTVLADRPDIFPAWDTLSDAEKTLYARQMEVFAGYSENADWNVGRLLDELDEMGELDNTLIFYIWGDNGASMEGTTTGSFNETTFFNGLVFTAEEQLALIDKFGGVEELGGEHTAPHFAAAWAHANNTPFPWGKQMASHLGGARDPMVVSWPGHIEAGGDLRTQFTHCIDVVPTILELIGVPDPTVVDGIAQEPMDGTSFAYTFADADAEERHTVQYFEMYGSRAIYQDGWWACARLDKAPWDFSPTTLARFAPGSGYDPDQDDWELYYLPDDFSQATNIAADHPDKLAELKDLFWQEAERNRVLPLLGGMAAFFGILPPMPTVTRFTYAGDVQNVSTTLLPRIYGRSYAIEAELHVPEGGAEGVLCAFADFIGGFSLWIDDQGHLVHTYQYLGVDTYKQVSTEPIPTGDVSVKMLFEADEPTPGTPGNVTLWANGNQIGEGRMPHSVAMLYTTYAGMDMGRDNGGVVDLDYEDKAPYAFTGQLKKVVFDLQPGDHQDELELHRHASTQAVAHGAAG
jgi:arylsulfatase